MSFKNLIQKVITRKRLKKDDLIVFWRTTAFILLVIVVVSQLFTVSITSKLSDQLSQTEPSQNLESESTDKINVSELRNIVVPSEGVDLSIEWGDLGKRMVADGVIDEQKFRAIFKNGLQDDEEQMLSGEGNSKVVLNEQNSRFILDMLWAFGLANKNNILEKGEMTDEKYGGDASQFAATGGWTLGKGPIMNHYSTHPYVTLSAEEQDLVDRVSRGVYRPCCGNSTHFPDCNHGMAMLGLLELMAANGVNEQEMFDIALKVNSIWFPQTYIDLATYFKEQGQDWNQVDAKLVLGAEYSSGQGYQATRQKIQSLPKPQQGGGSCGA